MLEYDLSDFEIHPERAESDCEICGNRYRNYDMERINGKYVCRECLRDFVICEECGSEDHYENMTECVGGGEDGKTYYLCSNCIGGERIAEVEAIC